MTESTFSNLHRQIQDAIKNNILDVLPANTFIYFTEQTTNDKKLHMQYRWTSRDLVKQNEIMTPINSIEDFSEKIQRVIDCNAINSNTQLYNPQLHGVILQNVIQKFALIPGECPEDGTLPKKWQLAVVYGDTNQAFCTYDIPLNIINSCLEINNTPLRLYKKTSIVCNGNTPQFRAGFSYLATWDDNPTFLNYLNATNEATALSDRYCLTFNSQGQVLLQHNNYEYLLYKEYIQKNSVSWELTSPVKINDIFESCYCYWPSSSLNSQPIMFSPTEQEYVWMSSVVDKRQIIKAIADINNFIAENEVTEISKQVASLYLNEKNIIKIDDFDKFSKWMNNPFTKFAYISNFGVSNNIVTLLTEDKEYFAYHNQSTEKTYIYNLTDNIATPIYPLPPADDSNIKKEQIVQNLTNIVDNSSFSTSLPAVTDENTYLANDANMVLSFFTNEVVYRDNYLYVENVDFSNSHFRLTRDKEYLIYIDNNYATYLYEIENDDIILLHKIVISDKIEASSSKLGLNFIDNNYIGIDGFENIIGQITGFTGEDKPHYNLQSLADTLNALGQRYYVGYEEPPVVDSEGNPINAQIWVIPDRTTTNINAKKNGIEINHSLTPVKDSYYYLTSESQTEDLFSININGMDKFLYNSKECLLYTDFQKLAPDCDFIFKKAIIDPMTGEYGYKELDPTDEQEVNNDGWYIWYAQTLNTDIDTQLTTYYRWDNEYSIERNHPMTVSLKDKKNGNIIITQSNKPMFPDPVTLTYQDTTTYSLVFDTDGKASLNISIKDGNNYVFEVKSFEYTDGNNKYTTAKSILNIDKEKITLSNLVLVGPHAINIKQTKVWFPKCELDLTNYVATTYKAVNLRTGEYSIVPIQSLENRLDAKCQSNAEKATYMNQISMTASNIEAYLTGVKQNFAPGSDTAIEYDDYYIISTYGYVSYTKQDGTIVSTYVCPGGIVYYDKIKDLYWYIDPREFKTYELLDKFKNNQEELA